MATKPSIKGSLISELVEDIKKQIAAGELAQSELEARLTAEDLALLEKPILPSDWYPVGFYDRCATLLRNSVGDGRNDYLRRRGFERGKKLIEGGLYQQMAYSRRTQVQDAMTPADRFDAYGRDLRLFVTLSKSVLNFSEWTVQVDPEHADRYVIVAEGVEDYPDALAWATEGLIDSMAAGHGLADLWRHDRPTRSQIRFRMTRSL